MLMRHSYRYLYYIFFRDFIQSKQQNSIIVLEIKAKYNQISLCLILKS